MVKGRGCCSEQAKMLPGNFKAKAQKVKLIMRLT